MTEEKLLTVSETRLPTAVTARREENTMRHFETSCPNIKVTLAVVTVLLVAAAVAAATHPGTWSAKADLPEQRFITATAEVNGIIYTIGGSANAQLFDTVFAFDPVGNDWTTKTPMPTPRDDAAAAVVNDKIYVIGGAINLDGNPMETNTVEVYDPATDSWEALTDMPGARIGPAAVTVDGKIFVIGGLTLDGGNSFYSTVFVYDPASDIWDTAADMPTARCDFGASVLDGLIYAAGGSSDEIIGALEVYDPATDTWTRAADMLTARDWLATAAVDGKMYAFGGWIWGDRVVDEVEVFDPNTGKWEQAGRMPDPRLGQGIAVVDGTIYQIGGATFSRYSDSVDSYDPDLYTVWTEVAAHLSGASGSQWRTDICAANLNNDAASVELVLHTDTGIHVHSDTIEATHQKAFDDVVGEMGIEDKGLLNVSSDQPLRVAGRTFNDGGDGTFGQMTNFRTMDDGLFGTNEAWIVGLRQEEGLFRTNVTVANAGIRSSTVILEFFDCDGTKLGQVVKALGPGTFEQILEPFANDVGAPNVGLGFLKVRLFGGAGILVSASVIDSRTNDATTIVAQR